MSNYTQLKNCSAAIEEVKLFVNTFLGNSIRISKSVEGLHGHHDHHDHYVEGLHDNQPNL